MSGTRRPGVFLHVDRDGLTGQHQMGISITDEDGGGHGYRIAGPKYLGASTQVFRVRLDRRTAAQIRRYLDQIPEEDEADG